MEPFELHDDDLLLSVPTAADVDRTFEVCQDPGIQRWTTIPSPYTREDAEGFVSDFVRPGWERDSPTWAIRLRDADGARLVGMVGLDGREHGGAEVGYWLDPAARGAGVMHRALGLVLAAGFDRLRLDVVLWRADVGNWPSWRVAWRHGFCKEGAVRRFGVSRGQRRDQWIGTLLAGDPREPVAPWDGPEVGEGTSSSREPDGPGATEGTSSSATTSTGAPDGVPTGAPDGERPDALVREFHERFAVPIAGDPPSVARERIELRMALVAEELAELVAAVYGTAAAREVAAGFDRAVASDDGARDTVAAADALADLVYVVYGMAQECSIPLPAVLAEVHRANLSKLGPGGTPLLREDGKVLKAAGYRAPDVAGVLDRQGR